MRPPATKTVLLTSLGLSHMDCRADRARRVAGLRVKICFSLCYRTAVHRLSKHRCGSVSPPHSPAQSCG